MSIDDIALTLIPGLGVRGTVHLLERYGTAEALFAASEESLATEGEVRSAEVIRAIRRKAGHAQAAEELRRCARCGIRPVASTDDEYPPLLRDTPDYPHVLYVAGDPAALTRRTLTMVGTRRATPYGTLACDRLVRELSERIEGLVVASGLAFGIDAACHRAALQYDVPTVAVVANPLPEVTPAQHTALARDIVARGGAIVSELHSRTRQNGSLYLARNRILAGMSAGTVVVESPGRGGALHTARCADGYGRTVMAVPGRITDPASAGTNALICNRQAAAVASGDDIARELAWEFGLPPQARRPAPEGPAPTPEERALLRCFPAGEPLSVERLQEASGLTAGELACRLIALELAGVIRQLPGGRYQRIFFESCN